MRIIIYLAIIFSIVFPSVSFSQNLELSGKWQMSSDPDGPVVEDWMIFQNNGTVQLGDHQGVYLRCTYKGNKNEVLIACSVKGKEKKMVMKVKNSFQDLINASGAIYSKRSS
jgi:hypothetical protein